MQSFLLRVYYFISLGCEIEIWHVEYEPLWTFREGFCVKIYKYVQVYEFPAILDAWNERNESDHECKLNAEWEKFRSVLFFAFFFFFRTSQIIDLGPALCWCAIVEVC